MKNNTFKYYKGYKRIDRSHLSLKEQNRLELLDWNKYQKNVKKSIRKKKIRKKKESLNERKARLEIKYKGWSYKELLTTPEWKRKRKTILKRDNYQCAKCKSTNRRTLQVHHLKYGNTRFPWIIHNKWLITLCKTCHEKEHSGV